MRVVGIVISVWAVVFAGTAIGEERVSRVVDRVWQATNTMNDVRSLTIAVAAYHSDNGRYPAAENSGELRQKIEPMYIRTAAVQDAWGTAVLYRVSEDGRSYVIASAGSDRKFDESSWDQSSYLSSSTDDLVYTSSGVKREWVIQDICH